MVGAGLRSRTGDLSERVAKYSALVRNEGMPDGLPWIPLADHLGVSTDTYMRSSAYQNIMNALNPAIWGLHHSSMGIDDLVTGRAIANANRSLDTLRDYLVLMDRYESFAEQELAPAPLVVSPEPFSEYVSRNRKRLVREEYLRNHPENNRAA